MDTAGFQQNCLQTGCGPISPVDHTWAAFVLGSVLGAVSTLPSLLRSLNIKVESSDANQTYLHYMNTGKKTFFSGIL